MKSSIAILLVGVLAVHALGAVSVVRDVYSEEGRQAVDTYLRSAVKSLVQKDYERALEIAKNGLEEYPSSAPLKYIAGQALYMNGDQEESTTYFRESVDGLLEAYQESSDVWRESAWAVVGKFIEYGMLKLAGRLCIGWHEKSRGDGESETCMAVVAYMEKNYEMAEVYWEKVVEFREEDPMALRILGEVKKELGKYEEAKQILLRGIQETDDDPKLWKELADVHEELGDEWSMLNSMENALRLEPKDTLYRARYAGNLFEAARFREALEELNRIKKEDPELLGIPDLQGAYGILMYHVEGDRIEARSALEEAIDKGGTDAAAYYFTLGLIDAIEKKPYQALRNYHEGLSAEGQDVWTIMNYLRTEWTLLFENR